MKTSQYLCRAFGVAVLAGSALVMTGATATAQTNCPTTTTRPGGATTTTTQGQSQSQSPAQSPAVAEESLGGFVAIAQTSCPASSVGGLSTTGISLGAVAAFGGGAAALALASRRVARRSV